MSTPRLPWDDVPEVLDPQSRPPLSRVRACVHGAAEVRLAAVRRHVLAHASAGVRVLAPTHEHAHDVVRHVLGDLPATVGIERGGWVGYSVRLATPALIAQGLTPISGLGFEALVARVATRARAEGTLSYFADASRHPGFVPALARTMADLRMAGTRPNEGPGEKGGGGARRRDLERLLAALESSLVELRYVDRAEVLRLATTAVREGTPGDVALPLALVDVPLTSRRDAEFAAALLSRSDAGLVAAPDGDRWTARLLATVPGWSECVDAADHARTPVALRRVHVGLFEPAALARDLPDDGSVESLSAPGEGRECVEVTRVLLEHAERRVPFDRMAIVMRAPELYASHMETALRRADIPAYFGRGTRRPDPAGRAFLALLTCAADDMSARRFAEYLSLGQVPLTPRHASGLDREPQTTPPRPAGSADTGAPAAPLLPDDAEALGLAGAETAPPITPAASTPDASTPVASTPQASSPWRWEAILNDAQVIGGVERWERRLRGYREEMRLRADAAFKDDPSSPRHESLRRRVTWTEELIAFAGDVIGDMAQWPVADDWGRWIDRLRAFAPRVLARPDRVLATLAELHPLAGVAHVTLPEICEVLRERLTHLPVAPPPHRYGRVFIGTPDQVRARLFDVVCVLGLSERVFPQRSRQDPLLLDDERAAISPDLSVDEDRLAAERVQLRVAAGAASRGLIASYASMETAQARPRVPSFYAVEVQRAVTGRVPGYEDLIREAQRRGDARLAWPAPQDPTRAIDAAEHDLSMLQLFLRGAETDVRGRARYLFGLNPALRRALVARHHRLLRPWSAHDGLVVAPERLASHRLSARTYSASALQRYATCPYQFYLSTILRLERREEAMPLTTLDPLTRGSMVHEMLARIMRTLIDRGRVPLTPQHLGEAQAVADAVVTDVAAGYADTLLPPILRVWDDAVAAIRRDIHEWVRRLTEDRDGWTPVHVELGVGFSGGFGRDEASLREHVVLADGTRLHGVVDLVERRGDEYRITDYKTGKHRLGDRVVVNGGRTLQPILYAMAVEAAFGGSVTQSRLYYCTEDGDYRVRNWEVTGAAGEDVRRQGLGVLAQIDNAVATGNLPAAPDAEACRWCDFAAVCGPGSQHVPARKDQKALADLFALRRLR